MFHDQMRPVTGLIYGLQFHPVDYPSQIITIVVVGVRHHVEPGILQLLNLLLQDENVAGQSMFHDLTRPLV